MIEWIETEDGDKWCVTGDDEVMFRIVANENEYMTTYIYKETLLWMIDTLEHQG